MIMACRNFDHLAVVTLFCISAIGSAAEQGEPKARGNVKAGNQSAPIGMVAPAEISDPAMKSGCWVKLFDDRNFEGKVFTIVGPMQLDTIEKPGGRQLRDVDSLIVGPKAKLTFYERKFFQNQSMQFGPNSKEAVLIKRRGFMGRIQSIKLDCSK